MLILTRRPGDRLRIGESVVITVLGARDNQVRLGIDAPRDVAVDRAEIAKHKRAQCPGSSREPQPPHARMHR